MATHESWSTETWSSYVQLFSFPKCPSGEQKWQKWFDHIPCSHPPIISHYIMWHEYPLISFNMMQFAEDGPHLRISESDHFSKFFPIFSAFQPASTQLGPGTSELKLVRWETWQLSLGQEMPGESNMISIRKASNFGGKCCTQTAGHVQTIHFWATDLEPYNQWGCELSA